MQLISSTIVSVAAAVILLVSPQVLAVDPQGWYAANPGLSKIGLVDQSINQITDVHGRVRFFHGTNVVMKSAPWYRNSNFDPPNSFGPQDVKNLQDLGVNAVRLGHHWAGAEPVRGQYNQTFLDIMKSQTQLAEDHGIYVLVDVHQDVMAAQFCGHGVPNVSLDNLYFLRCLHDAMLNCYISVHTVVRPAKLGSFLQKISISSKAHTIYC